MPRHRVHHYVAGAAIGEDMMSLSANVRAMKATAVRIGVGEGRLFRSFEIAGFKGINSLALPGLGRINLLVGKNNVGKSTVLEAVRLRAAGLGTLRELARLLEARHEYALDVDPLDERDRPLDVRRLFYCGASRESGHSLSVGPDGTDGERLRIVLGWSLLEGDPNGDVPPKRLFFEKDLENVEGAEVTLKVLLGGETVFRLIPTRHLQRPFSSRTESALPGQIVSQFLPASGLPLEDLGRLWDSVALTVQEDQIVSALNLIEPGIERISLVQLPRPRNARAPFVRVKGESAPVPLKALGDGMNKIFELALCLGSARGGVFLIDEVENGLHFSVQPAVWGFLFQAASLLDVQVFATTHSWDCISAFQGAAAKHPESGLLVRLARDGETIRAFTFQERELAIVTRDSIEVR